MLHVLRLESQLPRGRRDGTVSATDIMICENELDDRSCQLLSESILAATHQPYTSEDCYNQTRVVSFRQHNLISTRGYRRSIRSCPTFSLHRAEPAGGGNASVHLCNLACQTGVSRFAQVNEGRHGGDGGWSYDKTEGLDFVGKAAYR